MATKLTDTQTLTGGSLTTGVKNPATLTKFPEAGATFQVTAVDATDNYPVEVELRAWVAGSSTPEILASFTLPVTSGDKAGDLFDSQPVFSVWDDWDWNVVSIGAASSITLSAVGVGV